MQNRNHVAFCGILLVSTILLSNFFSPWGSKSSAAETNPSPNQRFPNGPLYDVDAVVPPQMKGPLGRVDLTGGSKSSSAKTNPSLKNLNSKGPLEDIVVPSRRAKPWLSTSVSDAERLEISVLAWQLAVKRLELRAATHLAERDESSRQLLSRRPDFTEASRQQFRDEKRRVKTLSPLLPCHLERLAKVLTVEQITVRSADVGVDHSQIIKAEMDAFMDATKDAREVTPSRHRDGESVNCQVPLFFLE